MKNKHQEQSLAADNQSSVQINALSHDGRGIATIGNKTTFISGALPNEKVSFKIVRKRSQFNEAEIETVVTPAAERITPPCEHFGVCGGCSLQHMHTDTQLAFKQQTLLDQLKHFGQLEPLALLAPLNAATVGYRRKARLGVKYVYKKNKLLIGFREKASHYLADLHTCAVLHPAVGKHLPDISALISTLSIYNKIPQVEVAIGDTTVALVFRHMADLSDADKAALCAFGEAQQYHIYLQPNSPQPITKLWPNDGNERLTYTLPAFNCEFFFHPLDFTQVNLEMNRLIVQQALTHLALQASDHVLDLFCGIGNFSLPIARHAQQVTGIEGSQEMVERASTNAAHNHLDNVSFFAANLQTPPTSAPWLKQHYDKILLDPPRAGAKEMLPFLGAMGAKKIVYVSCNPATLARDAGILVHEHGYTLTHAGVMNMFPHTSHIEAMAVFEKN